MATNVDINGKVRGKCQEPGCQCPGFSWDKNNANLRCTHCNHHPPKHLDLVSGGSGMYQPTAGGMPINPMHFAASAEPSAMPEAPTPPLIPAGPPAPVDAPPPAHYNPQPQIPPQPNPPAAAGNGAMPANPNVPPTHYGTNVAPYPLAPAGGVYPLNMPNHSGIPPNHAGGMPTNPPGGGTMPNNMVANPPINPHALYTGGMPTNPPAGYGHMPVNPPGYGMPANPPGYGMPANLPGRMCSHCRAKPCYVEPSGRVHDFCGRTCANAARGQRTQPPAPSHGFNNPGYPAGPPHNARGTDVTVEAVQLTIDLPMCAFPGCTKPVYVDTNRRYDYCGMVHKNMAQQQGLLGRNPNAGRMVTVPLATLTSVEASPSTNRGRGGGGR